MASHICGEMAAYCHPRTRNDRALYYHADINIVARKIIIINIIRFAVVVFRNLS